MANANRRPKGGLGDLLGMPRPWGHRQLGRVALASTGPRRGTRARVEVPAADSRRRTRREGPAGRERQARARLGQALLLRVQGDERALQGLLPGSLGEAGRWLPQPGWPHGVEGLGHLGGCALRLVIL